jgi:hypothetical protein
MRKLTVTAALLAACAVSLASQEVPGTPASTGRCFMDISRYKNVGVLSNEVKERGLEALKSALGPAGAARFIQQYENGCGNYTKEKYQRTDLTLEEADRLLQ